MCALVGGLFESCDPAIAISFTALALIVAWWIVRALSP